MINFGYTARNRAGARVTGVVAAPSKEEAASMIRAMSLFPVDVTQQTTVSDWKPRWQKRVKQAELVRFYSQISDLLRSGVPLLRCLDLLARQSVNPRMRETVADIRSKVADGRSVADAMSDHADVFGELSISMVRAGQEGGFLEDVFKRIAVFTERQEDLKGRVIGALAYPVALLVIGTLILTVLLVFFVPKFADIFERLKQSGDLPFVTEALLATSEALQRYGLFILAGIGLGVWALRRWMKTPTGRRIVDRVKLKTPLLGVVFRDFAIVRFNRVLGTLRKNGIPILQALRIAKDSTGNVLMMEAIEKAAENVKAGEKLATPLRASGVFPPDIVEMIEVAEESNSLEQVLVESADSIETRTGRQLDLAVRFLEPLMLVVMAALTLLVVIALLLPIFKMNSAVG